MLPGAPHRAGPGPGHCVLRAGQPHQTSNSTAGEPLLVGSSPNRGAGGLEFMDQGRREAPSAAGVRLFPHGGGGCPVPPTRHGGEVAYTSFPTTRCPRAAAASQLTEKPSGEMLSPLLQDKGCAGRWSGTATSEQGRQPGSRSSGLTSLSHTAGGSAALPTQRRQGKAPASGTSAVLSSARKSPTRPMRSRAVR